METTEERQDNVSKIVVLRPGRHHWQVGGDVEWKLRMELVIRDNKVQRILKVTDNETAVRLSCGRKNNLPPLWLKGTFTIGTAIAVSQKMLNQLSSGNSTLETFLDKSKREEQPTAKPVVIDIKANRRSKAKAGTIEKLDEKETVAPRNAILAQGGTAVEGALLGYGMRTRKSNGRSYDIFGIDIDIPGTGQHSEFGVGLEDAIQISGVVVGDRITVINHGWQQVEVPIKDDQAPSGSRMEIRHRKVYEIKKQESNRETIPV